MGRSGDDNPPEAPRAAPEQWTQRDLDMLHDMVRFYEHARGPLRDMEKDYENARWFRRQAKWWALWILGLPAAALTFWEPMEKLLKLIRGGK